MARVDRVEYAGPRAKLSEDGAHERAHQACQAARGRGARTEPEASPIAPDCSGQDFYAHRPGLAQLLALYLPADVHAHLEPHFARLGVLAGGRLDELARIADKNRPVLHPRDRFGRDEDWIEYHPCLPRDGGRSPSATSNSTP